MKKVILITAAIIIATNLPFSQGSAINKTRATAHNSALLDLSDTTKGILIPRMKKTNKLAITSPATGLMVYQTDDTTGFWYYNRVKWVQAIGPAGASGGISSCHSAGNDETLIYFNGCLYVKNTVESGTYTWANAKAVCDNLVFANKSNWYLPNRMELEYITTQLFKIGGQTCEGDPCPLSISGYTDQTFWTSTLAGIGGTSDVWYRGIGNGIESSGSQTATPHTALCVRR